MKKKIISILLLLCSVLVLSSCTFEKEEIIKDNVKFKQEFEALNKTNNEDGKENKTITISEKNPIVYSDMEELKELMNNSETFLVYFGYPSSPWCRSSVSYIIDQANNQGIDKIYYINLRPDGTKASDLRGVKSLDENNQIVVESKPKDEYESLYFTLNPIEEQAYIYDNNGNKVDTREKHIFDSTLAVFVNGTPVSYTTGISSKQKESNDPYYDITVDMQDETMQLAKEIYIVYNSNRD